MGLERLLEETPEAYYWIGFIMADGSIIYSKVREDFQQIPKARIRIRNIQYGNIKSVVIQTCNKKFLNYLKDKTLEFNLPCLKRKWDRVY